MEWEIAGFHQLKGWIIVGWLRIEYIRGEKLKYISHLDLIRVFERATRRGNIPIGFSEGFNPRAKMVFGLPLSVGVIADKDYADIEIDGEINAPELIKAFNKQLPQDLQITDAKERKSNQNIMAVIKRAEYVIKLTEPCQDLAADMEKFLSMCEVIVVKEKEGIKKKQDIRPFVYKLEAQSDQKIFAQVCAGNEKNLRPDILIKGLTNISKREYIPEKIIRLGLFTEVDGKIVTPFEEKI